MDLEMTQHLTVVQKNEYVKRNKHSPPRGKNDNLSKFMQDRVVKLTELYERYTPEVKRTWHLPAGETDGRKAIIVEEIIGEDISPFDLPDFNEIMPKPADYNVQSNS